MADEKKVTGKKGKKEKKMVMSLDQFIAAPVVEDVIDWAGELEQNLPLSRNYGSASNAPVALPSGPRSMMGGPDIDYDSYPHNPPFQLVLDNAPFDVTETEIIKFFGKDIVLKEVNEKMEFGHKRPSPCVEFATREMMIKALREKQNTTFNNRTVNLKTPDQMNSQSQDSRGKFSREYTRRPEDGPDPTLGQWRNNSTPMQDNQPPPNRDFANLRDRPVPPPDMNRPPFPDNRQNMRDRPPGRDPDTLEIRRNMDNIPPPAQNFSRPEPRDFEIRRGGPSFERIMSREGSEYTTEGSSRPYTSPYGEMPPPGWDSRPAARPHNDRYDARRSDGPQSARDEGFRRGDNFNRGARDIRPDVVIERRSSSTMAPPLPPVNHHVMTRDRPPNFQQEMQQQNQQHQPPQDFRGRQSHPAPPRFHDRNEPPRNQHDGDIRRSSFEHREPMPVREPPRYNKPEEPVERPKLVLAPRTVDTSGGTTQVTVQPSSAIFGGAKPVDTLARERELQEKIERDLAAAVEAAKKKAEDAAKAKEEANAAALAARPTQESNAEELTSRMGGLNLNNADNNAVDRRNNNSNGQQQRGGFHNNNNNHRNDQNRPVGIVRPPAQNASGDPNRVQRSGPSGHFDVTLPPRNTTVNRQLSNASTHSQDKSVHSVHSVDGEADDKRKVSGGDVEEEEEGEEEKEEDDGFITVTNHRKDRSSNPGQFTGSRVFTSSSRGGRGGSATRGGSGGQRGAPGQRRPYNGAGRGPIRGNSNSERT